MDEQRLPLGKTCTKCGEWKLFGEFYPRRERPGGVRSKCKACGNTAAREHRKENPEVWSAYDRANREKNADKRAEYKRRYRQERRERYLELERQRNKRRYERDREKVLERNAAWRRENPEKIRAAWDRWEQGNPELRLETGRKYQHKRRAWLADSAGEYTLDEWAQLCAKHDHSCVCCGEKGLLTVDHVVLLSLGGANDITNIQPLCGRCNSRKGATAIDYR